MKFSIKKLSKLKTTTLVIFIIVLGFTCWQYYRSKNSSPTTILNIKEWRVKLRIKEPDAYYSIDSNNQYAEISTRQLDLFRKPSMCSGDFYDVIKIDKKLTEVPTRKGPRLACADLLQPGDEAIATQVTNIKAHIRASLPYNGGKLIKY